MLTLALKFFLNGTSSKSNLFLDIIRVIFLLTCEGAVPVLSPFIKQNNECIPLGLDYVEDEYNVLTLLSCLATLKN